jgi:nitroreductase
MTQNIEQVIRTRKSIRTYTDIPIEAEKKKLIVEFINSNSVGIFGNKVEFFLIDANSDEFKDVRLGTYGVISGTKYFITGKIKDSNQNFEDFGYCMEKLILFCTQLNLGTCWLGGTYKKTAFSEAIDLKEDEIIPAVSPVGYFGSNRSLVDRAFRYAVGADNRKPFDDLFFSKTFNQKLSEQEKKKYGFYLEMVRLAPSASNKEPWRIVLTDNIFHFYLKRTPNYNKTILHSDLQRIDMGIAISHFDLALTEKNISHKWIIENPSLELEDLVEYIASCEII